VFKRGVSLPLCGTLPKRNDPFTPPTAACPKHRESSQVAYRQHHPRKTENYRPPATPANMLFAIEIFFAFLLPLVAALKFDIQAHPGHESASKERCIRNFVAKDQLVVVTATVSGSRGDGQTLNMHVSWLRFGKDLGAGSGQLG
jgi:hypothetical protein